MSIRSTVDLTYNGETKTLKVTFDVIDRASTFVDWASLPEKLSDGARPYTSIAKFIFFCIREAGHDVDGSDLESIYDEINATQENGDSYMLLSMELAHAFAPKGKKKPKKAKNKK